MSMPPQQPDPSASGPKADETVPLAGSGPTNLDPANPEPANSEPASPKPTESGPDPVPAPAEAAHGLTEQTGVLEQAAPSPITATAVQPPTENSTADSGATESGATGTTFPDAIPNLHLHSLWGDLLTGLGFFTRLPVPATNGNLADAGRLFSLIGALIGCAATLFYVFGLWIGLSALMSAILALAGTALLTGALHEDGLADFVDMLGVRGDRDRKLKVMRDSTIGSYGTLALIFVSLMKIAALADLAVPGQVAGALISAHALSRGVLPLVMRSYPLARSNGLAVHAGKPPAKGSYVALALAILIAGFVGGPGAAFVATLSALVAAFLIAHIAFRQIGGYTGDVLGAAEQIIEVTVIVNFVSFT